MEVGEFTNKKSPRSMLGEEYCPILLSSTPALFQWQSRANGWFVEDHSSPDVEASQSRERMVVLCMSIAGHMMREKALSLYFRGRG